MALTWEDALLHASNLEATGDSQAAAAAYQQLADAGCPEAIDALAQAYLDGTGVEQSSEHAVALFEKAIGLGYTPSMYNLGAIYYSGHYGPDRDLETGVKLLERAAEGGDSLALAFLASIGRE